MRKIRSAAVAGLGGLVAAILLSGCAAGPDHEAVSASTDDTATGADLLDHLPDAGLAELASESDLVVRGTVEQLQRDLQFSDPNLEYTVFTVAVTEALGDIGRTATVDVVLLTHESGSPLVFEGRPTPDIGDDGVWLLTAMAPEFNFDGYVLTNQSSLVLAGSDRQGLRGGGQASPVAGELARLRSLDEVMSYLRSTSGS